MFNLNNKSIKIFADGVAINKFKDINFDIVDGFTYNPTLFKEIGVSDYYGYSKKIVEIIPSHSISLEIIADNHEDSPWNAFDRRTMGRWNAVWSSLRRLLPGTRK